MIKMQMMMIHDLYRLNLTDLGKSLFTSFGLRKHSLRLHCLEDKIDSKIPVTLWRASVCKRGSV